MALLRVHLTGSSLRFHADATGGVVDEIGIIGLDVSPKSVGDTQYSIVQLILDENRPAEKSLLEVPLVAELLAPERSGEAGNSPRSLARELFDHYSFRRKLQAEQEAGESVTRGILLLTNDELPPPWIRLAFLPVALKLTVGMDLVIHRTTVEDLVSATEQAFADGAVNEDERRNMLISIEQHHPVVSDDQT